MSQNDSQNTINNNDNKKKTQDVEVSSAASTTMMTEKPSSISPPVEAQIAAVPKQPDTITVPREQYQTLLQLNMKSFETTLNILDSLDKIIGSLINMQGFVMNIKETIKRTQLGMTTNNSQQQQPSPPPS